MSMNFQVFLADYRTISVTRPDGNAVGTPGSGSCIVVALFWMPSEGKEENACHVVVLLGWDSFCIEGVRTGVGINIFR